MKSPTNFPQIWELTSWKALCFHLWFLPWFTKAALSDIVVKTQSSVDTPNPTLASLPSPTAFMCCPTNPQRNVPLPWNIGPWPHLNVMSYFIFKRPFCNFFCPLLANPLSSWSWVWKFCWGTIVKFPWRKESISKGYSSPQGHKHHWSVWRRSAMARH